MKLQTKTILLKTQQHHVKMFACSNILEVTFAFGDKNFKPCTYYLGMLLLLERYIHVPAMRKYLF